MIQLQCSDPDGDETMAEILTLPSMGALYQASYSINLKQRLLGQPIVVQTTSNTTGVLVPGNVIAYVPADNVVGLTSFRYRCRDKSQVSFTDHIA
mgnify:CR=1 FL=1